MPVKLIPPILVDSIWGFVAVGLGNALEASGGDIDANYLWRECRSGSAFLFTITDESEEIVGASVWRVESWSTGKKLRCLDLFCTAPRSSWLEEHEAKIMEIAEMAGVNGIVTEGRKGFERLYPKAKVLRQLYELKI